MKKRNINTHILGRIKKMGKYRFRVSRQAKAWFDDIVSVEAKAVVYGRGTRRIQCGLRYG